MFDEGIDLLIVCIVAFLSLMVVSMAIGVLALEPGDPLYHLYPKMIADAKLTFSTIELLMGGISLVFGALGILYGVVLRNRR